MISKPTKEQKDRMAHSLRKLIGNADYTVSEFAELCGMTRQIVSAISIGKAKLTDSNYILFMYVFNETLIENPTNILLGKCLDYVKEGTIWERCNSLV